VGIGIVRGATTTSGTRAAPNARDANARIVDDTSRDARRASVIRARRRVRTATIGNGQSPAKVARAPFCV
jgi:hypothetical protein